MGFRYTAKDVARGFDVCGSVANLPDGTVELEVMGEPDEVERYLRELTGESPVAHHIKTMRTESIPRPANMSGFTIRR